MKPRLLLCAAVASSIALLAACGGAKDNELFAGPSSDLGSATNPTEPDSTGTGTEPSSTSSGGSSGTSGASSTSSGGSSTSSGGSSTSSGGSSTSSGGSTSSSGGSSSGGSSGGSTSSSGGTSNTSGISCGEDKNGDAVYCSTGSACCAKDGGGFPVLTCSTNGWCQGGLAIKCDDQSDCPFAQVCCGQFDENIGYKSVSCSAACINIGSTRGVRFCDQNAATDECAQIGKTCQWSGSLPGYSVCK